MACPCPSPSSDQRLWSSLRSRVDAILDEPRRQNLPAGWPSSSCAAESESGKRFREDALLLMRGFDSVSSSLVQLTGILNDAAQEARELGRPSLTEVLKRESEAAGEDEPEPKRLCSSNLSDAEDKKEEEGNAGEENVEKNRNGKLEKVKKMAVSMASKAASLARELKKIKGELGFMHDRCNLLEEENRRLRDGLQDGLRPEEDDLVRLQLEALLAEKSRLANENATLMRENQCLHDLVEYHQLTSQELSEDYEETIQGMCLDFSPFVEGGSSDAGDETGCAKHKRIELADSCTARALDGDFAAIPEH